MADAEEATQVRNPQDLIAALTSSHWQERQAARRGLIEMGSRSTPVVVQALRTGNDDLRWEAARTLRDLRDPESMPALIDALEDDNGSVRWLASEALAAIGAPAVVPLLRRLLVRSDSVWLQEGSHHVLHANVSPELTPVVRALEGPDAAIAVLSPVNDALAFFERTR